MHPGIFQPPQALGSSGIACGSLPVVALVTTEYESGSNNRGDDMAEAPATEGRVARRQRRNRAALIRSAREVMAEKGVDAATMLEIAERADMGAGTIYNYFKSKDELAVAVLESLMHDLAQRIEVITDTFDDPAEVYAFGIRTVLDIATTDPRWQALLPRAEVIANALFRTMGPFAIRDLRMASQAGRFEVSNPELVWRLSTHALIGAALSITQGEMPDSIKDQVVVRLLCMTGISPNAAVELAARERPPLSGE